MHPLHVEMHLPHAFHVLAHYGVMFLRAFPLLLRFSFGCDRRNPGGIQLVGFVPADRIGFQGLDHFRERVAQGMLWLPANEAPGARDVEFVVVVRNVNHPRLDEGILVEDLALDPSSGPGQRLRNRPRLPILVVNEPRHLALNLVKAECLRLSQKQRQLRRQILAPLHDREQRVGQVVQMQKRLPCVEIARIDVADELALVYPRDLPGQERRMAHVIVDAGRTDHDSGDGLPLFPDQRLGANLRFPIGQLRVERPVRVNRFSLPPGRMHQHRAGENELFDLEFLKPSQQPFRAADGHLLVFRVRFACEIEIGGEMDHRCNAVAIACAQSFQRRLDAVVRGEIDADAFGRGGRMGRGFAIKTDKCETPGELFDDRRTDEAAASGNDDNFLLAGHTCLPLRFSVCGHFPRNFTSAAIVSPRTTSTSIQTSAIPPIIQPMPMESIIMTIESFWPFEHSSADAALPPAVQGAVSNPGDARNRFRRNGFR